MDVVEGVADGATSARSVRAGRGAAWMTEGWALVSQDSGLWIVLLVVLMIVVVLLSFVPLIGSLVLKLISPALNAGLLLGCQAQQKGQPLRFRTLWAGFDHPQFGQLILLGLAFAIFGIVIRFTVLVLAAATFGPALLSGDLSGVRIGVGAVVAVPVTIGLLGAFVMATWLATPLVVLSGFSAGKAMRESFSAGFKNVSALLIFGGLSSVTLLVAILPLGLGLLIWLPVMVGAGFAIWRDLYG